MSKQYLQLPPSRVKVAAYVKHNPATHIRFLLFAAAFTGIFYFFSGAVWRALSGG